MSPWYLWCPWRDLWSFPFYCFPLFLCIDHGGTLSYLSLRFFGTLHSNGYLSFSPLRFTSFLFTATCKASSDDHFALLYFLFLGVILTPVSYTMSRISAHSSSDSLSIRSNPLNLLLRSLCQHIWKTQQWPQDWKKSVSFHSNTKKGNAKECSNYHTIVPISHTSK